MKIDTQIASSKLGGSQLPSSGSINIGGDLPAINRLSAPQHPAKQAYSSGGAKQYVANGLNNLGGSLANLGKQLAEINERDEQYRDAMWVQNISSETQKSWLDWFNNKTTKPHEGMVTEFKSIADSQIDKITNSAPSERAAVSINGQLSNLSVSMFQDTMLLEAKTRQVNTVSDINKLVMDASDMIAKSHSPEVLHSQQKTLMGIVDMAVGLGKLNKGTADSFKASIADLSADAAEHFVSSNPRLSKKIIEEDEGISLPRRTAVNNKIEAALRTHDSLVKAQMQDLLKNNITQIEETGSPNALFDLNMYANIVGEGSAFEAGKLIATAQYLYQGKTLLAGKSPTNISTILTQLTPKPGDANYANKVNAFNEVARYAQDQIKLLNDDPFTYSMQDPIVKRTFEDYVTASDELKPDKLFTTISTNLKYQEMLGIPEGDRLPIPKQQALAMAANINQAKPDAVENELKNLMNTYGSYYPSVLKVLSRLPPGDRIDTSIQFASLHSGKSWVNNFISAVKTPEKDFNIPDDVKKEINERIFSEPAINKLKQTLFATGLSEDRVGYASDISTAVFKYASQMVAGGESPSKAVKKASELLINSEFAFRQNHNADITFAVRRKYTAKNGQTAEYTDNELNGMQEILGYLSHQSPMKSLRAFNEYGYPGTMALRDDAQLPILDPSKIVMPTYLMPSENPDMYAKHSITLLQNNAFWATTEDGESVALYLPGPNGTSQRLKYKDGKDVIFTTKDLVDTYSMLPNYYRPSNTDSLIGFKKMGVFL